MPPKRRHDDDQDDATTGLLRDLAKNHAELQALAQEDQDLDAEIRELAQLSKVLAELDALGNRDPTKAKPNDTAPVTIQLDPLLLPVPARGRHAVAPYIQCTASVTRDAALAHLVRVFEDSANHVALVVTVERAHPPEEQRWVQRHHLPLDKSIVPAPAAGAVVPGRDGVANESPEPPVWTWDVPIEPSVTPFPIIVSAALAYLLPFSEQLVYLPVPDTRRELDSLHYASPQPVRALDPNCEPPLSAADLMAEYLKVPQFRHSRPHPHPLSPLPPPGGPIHGSSESGRDPNRPGARRRATAFSALLLRWTAPAPAFSLVASTTATLYLPLAHDSPRVDLAVTAVGDTTLVILVRTTAPAMWRVKAALVARLLALRTAPVPNVAVSDADRTVLAAEVGLARSVTDWVAVVELVEDVVGAIPGPWRQRAGLCCKKSS
ncbi:hypothetical protein AMAG_19320 [Allomyces macrogynus ATCC 38327]|uniref:Uncharacterized protein n=1 Tax=Allomyces macrogynus (strain ATCC 38327) TaxID=578462 RepID=A0A0L0SU95_ALLM3|nr:hypothetical protein AMAG_19320 [Allomyces macrogynus ATCC 38327]|eukprot:KNE66036.1 hypothetical protein AMAG_19320 [Allomyces macrogynus ATCC 38327]